MNKSMIIISLGIILIICSACNVSLPEASPTQPANVPDPTLRQAWLTLYSQTEPFPLWEGVTTSGRTLAQFVLDHHIPIVWDTDNVCGGSSCSQNHCTKDTCDYNDSQPLYILPSYQQNIQGLQGVLAHEIFHRTQPFGAVHGTRYEEFWAYKIDAHFTGDTWVKFNGYNLLDPSQLAQWYMDNQIHGYYELQYYPPCFAGVGQAQLSPANLVQNMRDPSAALGK